MYYSAIHVKTLILHTKICSNLCQIFNTCTLIYMYLHRFLICHRYPFRVRPGLFANLHFFRIMYFLFFLIQIIHMLQYHTFEKLLVCCSCKCQGNSASLFIFIYQYFSLKRFCSF